MLFHSTKVIPQKMCETLDCWKIHVMLQYYFSLPESSLKLFMLRLWVDYWWCLLCLVVPRIHSVGEWKSENMLMLNNIVLSCHTSQFFFPMVLFLTKNLFHDGTDPAYIIKVERTNFFPEPNVSFFHYLGLCACRDCLFCFWFPYPNGLHVYHHCPICFEKLGLSPRIFVYLEFLAITILFLSGNFKFILEISINIKAIQNFINIT